MTAVSELVLPELNDVNRGFWEGAARGELTLQRCEDCEALRYPPAEICPRCLSARTAWAPLSGRATLFSWAVFHHVYHAGWRDRVPYTVALVELEEGPRMFSNIVAPEGTQLSLGMPLQVVFEQVGDIAIPRFTPRGEEGTDASR